MRTISNIQTFLGKGSGWIIDLVIYHIIIISKYNPVAGSTYIELPKELDHPKRGLSDTYIMSITIQQK